MTPPTPRQLAALTFVRDYIARTGQSPMLDEIAAGIGTRNVSTVHRLLGILARKGYLTRRAHMPRGLDVLPVRTLDEQLADAFAAGWEAACEAQTDRASAMRAERAIWLDRQRDAR